MKRILVVLCFCLLFASQALAIELELANVRELTHPTVKADEGLAEAIAAGSEGRFTLSIGSAGSLYGDEAGIVDALIRGDVAFGHVSVRTLAERVPTLNVFALPYLINSADHLQAVLYGVIGESLNTTIEEWIPEVKVLAWYNCGGRCFYSKKQIASPFDMPGKTFCAEKTDEMVNFLTAMGVKHQWLARHTVYSALFQGVLDGAENDLISLVYLGDYDPARYILLDYHTFAPEVLLVSRVVYDLMDESTQAMLIKAVGNAEQREWDLEAMEEEKALYKLRDSGCSFTYMDNGVREAFVGMVKNSSKALGGKSVYAKAGMRNAELVAEIEKMGKSYPPDEN